MSLYVQPDIPLTEAEKLEAALVALDQRIPVGFQLGMPLHLDRAIAMVEKLFTEHSLAHREELIAQLTLWRSHAEAGITFGHNCDHLMWVVIRSIDTGS